VKYELPAERSVRILTLITFLTPILVYWFYTLDILLIGIAVIIPLLIVFIIVYTYTPKEVIVDDNRVIIKMVLGQIVVPYDKIMEVSFFGKLNWKTIRILAQVVYFVCQKLVMFGFMQE